MTEKNMQLRAFSGHPWVGVFLCLTILALALLIPVRASASLVVPLTIEEMGAASDQIVRAKVTQSQTEWYNGKLITRHKMAIMDSLKGDYRAEQEMDMATLGGQTEFLGSIAPGQPTFKPGEEVVLFLSDPPAEQEARSINPNINMESPLVQSPRVIGGFQGKFEIARVRKTDLVAGKEMSWEDVRVVRESPGRPTSLKGAPTWERFREELTAILDTTTKSLPRAERDIPMVGTMEVVKEQKSFSALRSFDPLPRRPGITEGLSERAPAPNRRVRALEKETQPKSTAEQN